MRDRVPRKPRKPCQDQGHISCSKACTKERDAIFRFSKAADLLLEEPDMVISEHVKIKGDLKFEGSEDRWYSD